MRLNREVDGPPLPVRHGARRAAARSSSRAPSSERARGLLRELHADAAASWRELEFAASFQARLDGVGVLRGGRRRRPRSRRAGRPRERDPRGRAVAAARDSGTEARSPPRRSTSPSGDVAARLRIRAVELEQSLRAARRPARRAGRGRARRVEPRPGARSASPASRARAGETVCVVEAERGRVRRMHLRTGSYANWPALARATAGELLPDFPLINKSFELCYACADR